MLKTETTTQIIKTEKIIQKKNTKHETRIKLPLKT